MQQVFRRTFSVSREIKGCIPWRVERRALTQKKEHVSKESDDSEFQSWYYKPVPQNQEACGRSLAGETAESSSTLQKSHKNKDATMDHFFAISPQTISYTEAVCDMVKKIYGGRPSDDPMEDLSVNVAIW